MKKIAILLIILIVYHFFIHKKENVVFYTKRNPATIQFSKFEKKDVYQKNDSHSEKTISDKGLESQTENLYNSEEVIRISALLSAQKKMIKTYSPSELMMNEQIQLCKVSSVLNCLQCPLDDESLCDINKNTAQVEESFFYTYRSYFKRPQDIEEYFKLRERSDIRIDSDEYRAKLNSLTAIYINDLNSVISFLGDGDYTTGDRLYMNPIRKSLDPGPGTCYMYQEYCEEPLEPVLSDEDSKTFLSQENE